MPSWRQRDWKRQRQCARIWKTKASPNLPIQSPNTAQSANPKPQEESQQNEMVNQTIFTEIGIFKTRVLQQILTSWHAGCCAIYQAFVGCPLRGKRCLSAATGAVLVFIGRRLGGIGCRQRYLWLCQNSYWKWPFIVDFPIKNGDFP